MDKKERRARFRQNYPGKPLPHSDGYYKTYEQRQMQQRVSAAKKEAKRQERLAAKKAAIAAARRNAKENGLDLNVAAEEVEEGVGIENHTNNSDK